MGLRSWIQKHVGNSGDGLKNPEHGAEPHASATPAPGEAPNAPSPGEAWEPLPAYLPVDPREHAHACVIASAIAAGDHPASEFRVRRVLVSNPEHRTVSVIATALAAGALPESSFTVKNIYKMKEEGSHAA